jgi:adenylate cyclase
MSDTLQYLDFDALIDRSLTDPAAVVELERRHRTEAAILVIDFSGMVQRTQAGGIIYALARARAAMGAMRPAIAAHGGQVIKQVADTFFAVFPDPTSALLAALDSQKALRTFNTDSPDPIHAGIGLGWGSCLLVAGVDVYGAEVSRAFVLGEDTAQPGEVLVTEAFLSGLGEVPDGIGSFRARHDRIHTTGFHFHQVSDYRA